MDKSLINLFLLLITNVGIVTGAQIFLKIGSNRLTEEGLSGKGVMELITLVIFSPTIVLGTLFYAMSLALWIYILTKAPISMAYPIMSLSYITVMIISIFLFKEVVNIGQWVGVILIIAGTSFIFFK